MADRFSVQGYPTMVVFNSAGNEVIRIPGGIETRRYLDVLNLVLEGGSDADTLFTKASQSPQTLSANELTRLAFYSWSQENLGRDVELVLTTLRALAFSDNWQTNLAVDRLLLAYLALQADLDRNDLSENDAQQAHQRIQSLLQSDDSVLANMDYLTFYPTEIVALLNLAAEEQAQIISDWQNKVLAQKDSPLLSKAERLATWQPAIRFYWQQNPDAEQIPDAMQQGIVAMVEQFNASTQGEERQSVINRAGNILRAANLYPQAKELITKELAISKSPYYFMSSMSEIAEETDDPAGAISWRRQAYENAVGKATRFQWGVEYITTLIKFDAQNDPAITNAINGLFGNLDQEADVFTGRNYGRLQTLLTSLENWQSPVQQDTLQQLNASLQGFCDLTDPASPARQQCAVLLAER